MKINEFYKLDDEQGLPFDAIDDLKVYMRNDPMFYRRYYYPMMAKISDLHDKGKDIDHKKIIGPVVDKGADNYCKQYKITREPSKIFPDRDKKYIASKIYSEEMPYVRKGTYRKQK